MPQWRMKGQYITNCNCLPHCQCDTIGLPGPDPFCEGMFAMRIQEGNFEGVSLNRLKWAAVLQFPGAVHEGNGTAEYFIDEDANDAQRQALTDIITGKARGGFFEIFAEVCPTKYGPHFVPIEFDFDKESRHARVTIPGFLETTSAPLTIPASDEEQRVIVRLPGGFEYHEAEIAYAATLKSTGAIKFDWRNRHSALADVEHTNEGLLG